VGGEVVQFCESSYAFGLRDTTTRTTFARGIDTVLSPDDWAKNECKDFFSLDPVTKGVRK
jgi:hypothetical protein